MKQELADYLNGEATKTKAAQKVRIGTQFRYGYADANPLWEVKSSRGRGAWQCVVVGCPDYSGTRKVFSSEEINRSVGLAKMWQKSGDESDMFFAGLTPGDVVHQSHMGDGYVRCVVTDDRQLRPIALVGDWREYDLPRRNRDGSIELGFHAKKIQEKESFRPHASHIYEYNVTRRVSGQPIGFAKQVNPIHLKPLLLTVPDMTEEQKATASLWLKIDSIRNALNTNEQNPSRILYSVKCLVG